MSGFQVVVNYGEQSFDSIRDTERDALFKVAEYMKKDNTTIVVWMGNVIQGKLIFGQTIESITDLLYRNKFDIVIKYIP